MSTTHLPTNLDFGPDGTLANTDQVDQTAHNYQSSSSQAVHPNHNQMDPPKVLARNSACHQCRKRKLKCNAQKPICTNCQKPRARSGSDGQSPNEAEVCTWDAPKEPSARTRRRRESARRQAMMNQQDEGSDQEDVEFQSKKAKLSELESRIAACHDVLKAQRNATFSGTAGPNAPASASTLVSEHTHHPSNEGAMSARPVPDSQSYLPRLEPYTYTSSSINLGSLQDIHVYPDVSPLESQPSATNSVNRSATSTADPARGRGNPWMLGSSQPQVAGISELSSPDNDLPGFNRNISSGNSPELYRETQADAYDSMFDVVWSDWPKDLPTFTAVERTVKVFFEKIPTLPRMLNKANLMQNLLLPPSHSRFPVRPLIHAILAVSSNFVSESSLASRAYFPVGASSRDLVHPTADFEDAKVPVSRSAPGTIPNGNPKNLPSSHLSRFQMWHRRKAFETFSQYLDRGDKFLECLQAYVIATSVDQYNAWWTELWLESGACVRMATPMRINESPNHPEESLRRYSNQLMEPAKTAMEQAERDRTWWMVYVLEKTSTGATTWPSGVPDDDITVELPVLQSTYDQGYGDLTGVQTFQSLDLLTSHPPQHRDSFCLLIKALKLHTDVNVFFRRYSRGTHSIAGYVSHPTFRLLVSQINTFRMSFPPEFRRPTMMTMGAGPEALDRDLVQALWVAHGASMCLGEPLITKDTWTHEGARMTLAAIRAALSMIYDITATSYDITLFSPHSSLVWCLASRGLIRFIDAAAESGDPVSASVFRSELEVFRLAMRRYGERFPVGNRHARMIDDILQQQESDTRFTKTRGLIYDCSKEEVFCPRAIGSSAPGTDDASTRSLATPSVASFTPQDGQDDLGSGGCDGSSGDGLFSSGPKPSASAGASAGKQGPQCTYGFANSPAMLNGDLESSGQGWDISSFSFDVNAIAHFFETTGAMFDGTDYSFRPN